MKLDGIILSQTSQEEKDKYHMISLISGIARNKTKKWTKQSKLQKFDCKVELTRGVWEKQMREEAQ